MSPSRNAPKPRPRVRPKPRSPALKPKPRSPVRRPRSRSRRVQSPKPRPRRVLSPRRGSVSPERAVARILSSFVPKHSYSNNTELFRRIKDLELIVDVQKAQNIKLRERVSEVETLNRTLSTSWNEVLLENDALLDENEELRRKFDELFKEYVAKNNLKDKRRDSPVARLKRRVGFN
jgi:hypothetical protein